MPPSLTIERVGCFGCVKSSTRILDDEGAFGFVRFIRVSNTKRQCERCWITFHNLSIVAEC